MTRLICHRDKKITDPSVCEYVAEGDQYIYNGEIAITESGAYFPYIANLSDETIVVQDLRICAVSE